MFFFSYRRVVVVLVGFAVAASLLAWPDSRFAFWVRRSTPLLGPIVLFVILLWARWKHERH
jgi:hypothetical protein